MLLCLHGVVLVLLLRALCCNRRGRAEGWNTSGAVQFHAHALPGLLSSSILASYALPKREPAGCWQLCAQSSRRMMVSSRTTYHRHSFKQRQAGATEERSSCAGRRYGPTQRRGRVACRTPMLHQPHGAHPAPSLLDCQTLARTPLSQLSATYLQRQPPHGCCERLHQCAQTPGASLELENGRKERARHVRG